jgi:hypothetical protein
MRDAVFKEHDKTFALASASSRAALEELEKCNQIKEKCREMTDTYNSQIDQMNKVH